MDKKRLILLIILLLAIVLIVLGVKGNVFKENRQNMELRSSGDDNSHWFHLSGVVVEKTFDTLLIELNEKEESSLFFDTTKVSLDCTKCKGDLEQVSEGNVIKFYFFKPFAISSISISPDPGFLFLPFSDKSIFSNPLNTSVKASTKSTSFPSDK